MKHMFFVWIGSIALFYFAQILFIAVVTTRSILERRRETDLWLSEDDALELSAASDEAAEIRELEHLARL